MMLRLRPGVRFCSHRRTLATAATHRRRQRQMADVLARKLRDDEPRAAWSYLGRIARKGSANAHHCSMMVAACDSEGDLRRIAEYMAEHSVESDAVLAKQLHGAWVRHGNYSLAVAALAAAEDGLAAAEVSERAFDRLFRCETADDEGALPYVAELVANALAQPEQLFRLVQRQGDADSRRRWLQEHSDKLWPQPPPTPAAPGWVTALHSAWVSAGDAQRGVALLADALSHAAVSADEAGAAATATLRRLQQPSSTSQAVPAAEYFQALQAAGLANAFHYSCMLEAAPSAAAGTALRKAMAESGIEPDAAVCTASHKLWLREGEVDKAAAALAEGVSMGRCKPPSPLVLVKHLNVCCAGWRGLRRAPPPPTRSAKPHPPTCRGATVRL